jgi:diguanylate cyclase (GGDEF)-like protein
VDSITGIFAQADRVLRRLPDAALITLGAAVLLALAALKAWATWHEVPVADFFLAPVAMVAWLARARITAYAMTALAAGSTIVMAGAAGAPPAAGFIGAGFRLVYYLVVVALVREAHKLVLAHAEEARVDALTAVANRRGFLEAAGYELARMRRTPRPLSLLYLDVDDFKRVNDSFGHAAGDEVLRSIGRVLSGDLRSTDVVARLGGDEFVVLMPETDQPAVRHVTRRLREDLKRVRLPDGASIPCSIGVATLRAAPESVAELIRQADELMYRAKRRGGDRVETALVESPSPQARRSFRTAALV